MEKAKADGVLGKDSLMMMILIIKWQSNKVPLKGRGSWEATTGPQKRGEFQKVFVNKPRFLKQKAIGGAMTLEEPWSPRTTDVRTGLISDGRRHRGLGNPLGGPQGQPPGNK